MFHHKHDHERRMEELNSLHDTGKSAIEFANKMEKTGKRKKFLWLFTLGLWGLLILMTVLITIHRDAPVGLGIICVIGGFFLLLLSVANFLYPYEFWEFAHSRNPHVLGGRPTNFAISSHLFSGVFGVIVTFGIVAFLLILVR